MFINKEEYGPWVIELDPTTACNLACHDCISANLLNQGGIEPERLLKLADEFKEAGVKAVVLIGGGEPMAHKEFGNIVDAFGKRDIHTGVTTNGTLMKKHLDVCAENVSWLRVSVDAGSPEVFQEFRPHISGKSQFDIVISNMKEFAKKKKGILGFSFLLLSKFDKNGKFNGTNAVDIEKAGILAKEIGCDYIEKYLTNIPQTIVELSKQRLLGGLKTGERPSPLYIKSADASPQSTLSPNILK